MASLFSYTLYQAKTGSVARDYDTHGGDADRYWYNIPLILICTELAFPGHHVHLTISRSITSHPLYPLLERLDRTLDFLTVAIVDSDYADSEPMLWRMKPLWVPGTQCCHVRDIDSVPNVREIQAVRYFESHDEFLVQGMRSHPNHNSRMCSVLGGLSGFKAPQLLAARALPATFEAFSSQVRSSQWGADLALLRRAFIDSKGTKFRRMVLDTMLSEHVHPLRRNRTSVLSREQLQDVPLGDTPGTFLALLDALTQWSGQPVDGRGDTLAQALEHECASTRTLKKCFSEAPRLAAFYSRDPEPRHTGPTS